jgi:hypothetical protein
MWQMSSTSRPCSDPQEPDRLDLHTQATGRGTSATVTVRRRGEVVTCERLDLAKSKERQKETGTETL